MGGRGRACPVASRLCLMLVANGRFDRYILHASKFLEGSAFYDLKHSSLASAYMGPSTVLVSWLITQALTLNGRLDFQPLSSQCAT